MVSRCVARMQHRSLASSFNRWTRETAKLQRDRVVVRRVRRPGRTAEVRRRAVVVLGRVRVAHGRLNERRDGEAARQKLRQSFNDARKKWARDEAELMAQRDAAITERDAALRDVSRQAEAFARRQDERDSSLLTYQKDADQALDRSSAAQAACAAALADAARCRQAAETSAIEAQTRIDRDTADATQATRDAAATIKRAAQEAALAQAAQAAADARANRSDLQRDAAEASSAASAAMRAEAVGYAADLTEAKLVADEDRDAAKAAAAVVEERPVRAASAGGAEPSLGPFLRPQRANSM